MDSRYRARNFPYTDLACERRRADTNLKGVEYKREPGIVGSWERIRITSAEGEVGIGRPKGFYNTLVLDRMDTLEVEAIEDASDEIARELCFMCDVNDILPQRVLVVGLGNPELTPDSIGPKAADLIRATMHIKDIDEEYFETLECSEIAVIAPGVARGSGIDSSVLIKGVCEAIRPNLVVAVDALLAGAVERLGTTVQISDTGIFPGSGIGNHRRKISAETVGSPVISIGIPTVIDSRAFSQDGQGQGGEPMLVSPKEINEIVSVGASIIAEGINRAFGLFY